MASVWYSVCGDTFRLCLCVLWLVTVLRTCHGSVNDAFYYNSDPLSSKTTSHHVKEHSIDIELLYDDEELHNHRKRDLEGHRAASGGPLPTLSTNLSEKVDPLAAIKSSSDLGLGSDNATVLKTYHNLGVNGTGQRKNPTSNFTAGPRHATGDDDDDVIVRPNILTPFDVGVGAELDKKELEENNITIVKSDTHIFYNSTMYTDPDIGRFYWVDTSKRPDMKVNELLSDSHRRAATVKLSFDFPFYGRFIKNVTVATGGFLYTGNYVHSWLAATQYIAPLMANFDTSLSNTSFVRYADNGTAFTVEWDRVALQEKPDSEFTFQTTLHRNGDIVFVYKDVPFNIKDIHDDQHPVKVGLSDAYILDRTVFYVRRKTIFEYHRVSFNREEIKNWTVIYMTALPTCLDLLNCSSCLTSDLNLNCTWCPNLNQCSTGLDRNRQFWIDKGCEHANITESAYCLAKPTTRSADEDSDESTGYPEINYIGTLPRERRLGAWGYTAVVFLILIISGLTLWTVYAYKYPHSASGQMLIRYRPSQWRWRRGEARYMAASVHM